MEQNSMRVLITGGTGFVGSHLLEMYLSMDPRPPLFATKRWRTDMGNIKHIEDNIMWMPCDLTDAATVNEVIQEVQPDIIHHLAAMSFVKYSFDMPSDTIYNNVMSTINLLEAIRKYSPHSVIQLAGSSEEYGIVEKDELPIKETNPTRPASPYGVSKLAQTHLAWQYAKGYGVKAITTRAFNHSGKRRNMNFILPKIMMEALAIKKGKNKEFRLGNIEAQRDFTHVKDICRAYMMTVLKAKPGEIYNICSGVAYSIKEIVEEIKKIVKIDAPIITEEMSLRPFDVPVLLGDNTKVKQEIGWQPQLNLTDILTDIHKWLKEEIL